MQIIYEHQNQNLILQANHNHFLEWPLHQHYYMEMVYFLEGSLCIEYRQPDDTYKTVTIHAGELFFLFPNVPHRYYPSPDKTVPDFYCFNFSPNLSERFRDIFLNNSLQNVLFRKNELHDDVLFVIDRFSVPEIVNQPREIIVTYLTLLLERLIPNFVLVNPFSSSKTQKSSESVAIVNYIQRHFNEDLTLDSISLATGINKYNISRFFAQKMNVSLRTYLNGVRIRHAQDMLINTDKDITHILLDCGYQNQQTFNRSFKNTIGITPTEYRAKYGFSVYGFSSATTNGTVYYEQLSPTHTICYRYGYEPIEEPVVLPTMPK